MIACLVSAALGLALSAPSPTDTEHLPLDTLEGLEPVGVETSLVRHADRAALRVVETRQGAGESVVLLPVEDFEDGVIEVELAGAPREDARPGMRGFVGIAFRVQGFDELAYDCFYLRPTNGRAREQVRRNHATQYVAHPAHPWHRLRREAPGRYESYVDLVPGAWTKVRIEVEGAQARLFVHGAEQPALVVEELLGASGTGSIALWIGEGTEAHFRDLRITRGA